MTCPRCKKMQIEVDWDATRARGNKREWVYRCLNCDYIFAVEVDPDEKYANCVHNKIDPDKNFTTGYCTITGEPCWGDICARIEFLCSRCNTIIHGSGYHLVEHAFYCHKCFKKRLRKYRDLTGKKGLSDKDIKEAMDPGPVQRRLF